VLKREVLVAAPFGGAVVRLGDGSALVVADVTASDGWPLHPADRSGLALRGLLLRPRD
jgi:hypothetical protein